MCGNACGGCKRSNDNVSAIVPMRVVGELVDMMAILMTEELFAAIEGIDSVLTHNGNSANSSVTYRYEPNGEEFKESLDVKHTKLSEETIAEAKADMEMLKNTLSEIDRLAGNPQNTVQLAKVLLTAGRALGL